MYPTKTFKINKNSFVLCGFAGKYTFEMSSNQIAGLPGH